MAWNPNLSYGASGDWFGHRDYSGNLKEVWDTMDAGAERQKALMKRRQDILSWMGTEEGKSKIREHNQLGVEPRSDRSGGLGHRIASGDITEYFMGQNMEIDPETGKAHSDKTKDYFGLPDLMHARASGKSWTDIFSHIDSNQNQLRAENVKGGGGLYDQIKTHANYEKQQGAWTDALGNLKTEMSGVSDTIKEEMGGVAGAITAQTAAADKYRADQANWQRRQENMQQMMIQEGRRKAKEKPVMTVMPGASSYGGGGGGAAAFARKKKQTTGLNIA